MLTNGSKALIRPEYHDILQGKVKGPTLSAIYHVSSSELTLESAAFHMAATISCGLGIHFDYLEKDLRTLHECCPKVSKFYFGKTPKQGVVELVIPLNPLVREDHLDVTQILNFIYGDFFEERQLTRIKLVDIIFSEEALDFFEGPLWGIEKIRQALNTSSNRRPHIGVVPHPPIGMNAEKYAKQCFQLAMAGADHIVDSDILVDVPHCSIEDRVTLVIEAIEKSRRETGKAVMYSVNITSDVEKLLENADRAIESCGKRDLIALGICVANTGLSALSMLRKYVERNKKPIHVHVTGLPLMTRDHSFGIDYRVFNTLVRLLGADIVHVPSLTGRYTFEETSAEDLASESLHNDEVLNSQVFKKPSGENIKTVFPMIAGGINPANAEYHVRLFGNDIILLAGAGLFREKPYWNGNFKTVQSIIRALCQAIEIIMNGENVNKVVTDFEDKRRKSEFKDLVNFWDRHEEEFNNWDWTKAEARLQGLARFRPYTA